MGTGGPFSHEELTSRDGFVVFGFLVKMHGIVLNVRAVATVGRGFLLLKSVVVNILVPLP
jgi:hypothetical protein